MVITADRWWYSQQKSDNLAVNDCVFVFLISMLTCYSTNSSFVEEFLVRAFLCCLRWIGWLNCCAIIRAVHRDNLQDYISFTSHRFSLSDGITTLQWSFCLSGLFRCITVYILLIQECVFLSAVRTQTHSAHSCVPSPSNPHQAHFTVNHCAIRPHSRPADPSAWCLAMSGSDLGDIHTSQWVHCHLRLYCALSARQWVAFFWWRTGAGVARSLCKWWKRVRELCWKHGPCSADRAGRWADRKAPFSPDSNLCDLWRLKKGERMCLMSRLWINNPDVNRFTALITFGDNMAPRVCLCAWASMSTSSLYA